MLIDTGAAEEFAENAWLGRKLALGSELRVEIVESCERCVMTTLAQGDLPRDPNIVKTLTRWNGTHCSVYARVLSPGILRQGDRLELV